MSHPASQLIPILKVAAALGLKLNDRTASCFNGAGHKSGRDAKPALVFLTDHNRFQCYACGIKGDAIDLVRQVRGCTFPEAVTWLSNLAGTTPQIPAHKSPAPTKRTPSEPSKAIYSRLYQLSYSLDRRSPAGKYLARRGLDLDLATQNHVTELDDPAEVWGCLSADFSPKELQEAGLASEPGRFLFRRHHLLFFFFDGGYPQFVVARDLTGETSTKELSLAGLHSPVPYLSDVLQQAPERVLVCEGCIDTLSATQLGYAAVGVPGVTSFREEWFERFRDVGQVTILFDNDDAGRRQAADLRARFRLHGIKADASFPAQGKDLNDLLISLTPETVQ